MSAENDPPAEDLEEALTLPRYDRPAYWDERYTNDPSLFEWYQDYASLVPLLDAATAGTGSADAAILQLGVGTSDLAADLVEKGHHRGPIVNIDISPVCVEHMKQLHAHLVEKGVSYAVGDACDMRPCEAKEKFTAENASFDVVIDKGTADALLCGSGADEQVRALVAEAARVLKPGGAFLLISYGTPDKRLGHLLPDCYTPSERGSEDDEEEDDGEKGDDDNDDKEEEEEALKGPYPGGRQLPWRPRDVGVYVIAKAERRAEVEAVVGRPPLVGESQGGGDADANDDDDEEPPAIFGPLCPTDAALMENVSALQSAHFAYVCRRPKEIN